MKMIFNLEVCVESPSVPQEWHNSWLDFSSFGFPFSLFLLWVGGVDYQALATVQRERWFIFLKKLIALNSISLARKGEELTSCYCYISFFLLTVSFLLIQF